MKYNKLFFLLWQMLPFIHKTIWFNFRCFPLKKAFRFPVIFLSKSKVHINGKCMIKADNIHFGMIKIGQNFHTNRPNTGVFINIKKGGSLIFNGTVSLGQNSSLEIGERGVLSLGDNFVTTFGILLYAYHYISIGNNCRIGWDTVVMDTSFHSLTFVDGGKTKGYGTIIIGNDVWIPSFCRVMSGAKIPDKIVFGSGSYISKDYSNIPSNSLMAGNPLTLKKSGLFRNVYDDIIEYEYFNK